MSTNPDDPQPLYKSLLRRTSLIEDDERAPVLFACLYFFCLLAGYFILRPLREQMGLQGGVKNLPYLWLGTLAGTLIANPPFAWLVSRFPRHVFLPWVYRFFLLNLVGFFALFQIVPAEDSVWISRVFYVWLSVFNMFAVTVFWGLMSELFKLDQARRLFGFIGVGGTTGALVGSALTGAIAVPLSREGGGPGLEWLMLVAVVLLECAVRCMQAVCRRLEPEGSAAGAARSGLIGGSFTSGVKRLLGSRYLQFIAAYIVLYTMASSVLYFQQAYVVDAYYADRPGDQTAFFARLNLAVQGLTLVLQLFLTGRIMRRIGVGLSLMALPVIVAIGFGALGLSFGAASAAGIQVTVTSLVVIAGVTVAMKGVEYALAKPARETLYTVVDQETRYKSKAFIDTFVYRAGDASTAMIYTSLGALGAATVAFLMIPVAALWMGASWSLGKRQQALANRSNET